MELISFWQNGSHLKSWYVKIACGAKLSEGGVVFEIPTIFIVHPNLVWGNPTDMEGISKP